MLSVVLYGRNDSHGYNLHKRGAVSLNAIAHLLRDADDELIFVDYNTPDDLPTFPEAIADTLTAHAREKLRILRVRPDQHARFARQTHLMALEPIARNVAVRRSNPANRWVLSTNTDMIFVPRDEGASLGCIVGGLADGFYHLPRFELPEALWESLDRADAPAVVKAAGEWGERFHLDEVVRSGSDNLFDGPGDFQLFLRDDLFAIGGFDEAMLKGWHVDANVARRMRFLRGEVRSAEALLRGYHCDHTRQASPYHKGDRVENDPVRFVDSLQQAAIPEQLDGFGLAGEAVEEVRLGNASSARYLAGLAASIPEGASGPLQTAYVAEAFGQLAYPLQHVLPYLLDLVSCIPEDARIGYLGARRDTFGAFATGWRAMGGKTPPVTPVEADWLPGGALPLEAWARSVDVFVFEVGAEAATEQKVLTPEERERLWWVNRGLALAFATDRERQRGGAPARRAIVVNAIHNSFEAQLFRHLSVTLTPFSSRIRHGFIVDPERGPPAHPSWRRAADALGRFDAFSAQEVAACAAALKALGEGGDGATAHALAGSILALAEAGAPTLADVAGPPVLDALRKARPPSDPIVCGVRPQAGAGAANRAARAEDWSEPAFLRMAFALFPNRRHLDPAERSPWSWERVALACNLDAAKPLGDRPRVLVAAELPELLAFMLSNLGARVDIADPRALAEGRLEAVDWRGELVENTFAVPASAEPLGLIGERAGAIGAGFRYDAVLIPQNGLFARGRDEASALLRQATALLAPGGHLGLAVFGLINDVPAEFYGDNLAADLLRGGRWAALMAESVGLAPAGGVDPALTPGTLDTLPLDLGAGDIPALVVRDGPALRAPYVFGFTLAAEGAADEDGWEAVNQALRRGLIGPASPGAGLQAEGLSPSELQALLRRCDEAVWTAALGSVLRRLEVGEGVARTPRSVRIPVGLPAGLVLSGPLGRLAPGDYVLRIQGAADGIASLQAFILSGGQVIARRTVAFDQGECLLSFAMPGPLAASAAFALRSPGGVDAEILDVILS